VPLNPILSFIMPENVGPKKHPNMKLELNNPDALYNKNI